MVQILSNVGVAITMATWRVFDEVCLGDKLDFFRMYVKSVEDGPLL